MGLVAVASFPMCRFRTVTTRGKSLKAYAEVAGSVALHEAVAGEMPLYAGDGALDPWVGAARSQFSITLTCVSRTIRFRVTGNRVVRLTAMKSSFDVAAAAASAREQVAITVLAHRQGVLTREQQRSPQHTFALQNATELVTAAEEDLRDVKAESESSGPMATEHTAL